MSTTLMKQKQIHASMQPYLEGMVLLLDKPLHWTSFDVVKKVRYLTGISKVGHAGTLDPLATGLLIVCTGKFTKKISEYMGMEKEYTGTFTLGATTPTYDLESEPRDFKEISQLSSEKIHAATKLFTGLIMQVPPAYSAIKKNGQPLYLAARKGIELKLDPRPVTIYSFSIEKIELPDVYFRVVCSTGTYIRSLANDFGAVLGVGGYMRSLQRTRIGIFHAAEAKQMTDFEEEIKQLVSSEGKANT